MISRFGLFGRPEGLRSFSILLGLRRPWLRLRDAPRLLLRRCDDRSVPWRDRHGLLAEPIELRCSRWVILPTGDFGSDCGGCGLRRCCCSPALKFHGDI